MQQKQPCKLFAAIALLLLLNPNLFCQGIIISGIITDSQSHPMEAAPVSLFRKSDSTLVKVELTGPDGRYEFSQISVGNYWADIRMLGYEAAQSALISVENQNITQPTIQLHELVSNLKEVTVSAQKPLFERRADRLVVNVENSILSTGSSALEVLERSPGVLVNQSDAISLRGRAGVIIMIDGKPTPLSGQDLANYLRALPSSSIERIDLITNPSAKYDAAGNAGIIDIRLKKEKNLGTNGSLSANYGQGVYPKAGAGLNLNYRNKKYNVFGGYNYSFRKGMNDLRLYREFFEEGLRTGAYLQRNYLVIPYNLHVARLGADFFVGPKTTLGVLATGSLNRFKPGGQNFSDVEDGAGNKISAFSTANDSKDVWPNYAFNSNLKHEFKQKGREINADLDYARYWNETDQRFTTRYYDLAGQENKPVYLLLGDLRGKLQIQSMKVDYTHPITGIDLKLESGIKSSIVNADNNIQFFDASDAGHPVFDSSISNHFIYRENINAAYLNLSRDWTKLSLEAGLRAENTIANGKQLVNGNTFKRNYLNWFPSAFLTYKFTEQYTMGLNMSRRLDRPSYQQLNPFKFFLDPSTYREGNPYLNPQFTWSFEWTHTIGQHYNINFAYAVTDDNITEVIGPVPDVERVTVQTDKNLAQVIYYSIGGSATLQPFPWWTSINNLNGWLGKYRGNFADTELRNGNAVLHVTTTNSFTLPKNWSAELNFTYKTNEIYGFMHLNPMWGLGFGIQKQFWDRKASIKLAATDVFWTNLPSAVIRYRDYVETFDVYRETRQITLSCSYRFGNKQVAQARKRASGAEEEKRRAGGG